MHLTSMSPKMWVAPGMTNERKRGTGRGRGKGAGGMWYERMRLRNKNDTWVVAMPPTVLSDLDRTIAYS